MLHEAPQRAGSPIVAEAISLLVGKADFDGTLAEARHPWPAILRRLENGPLKGPFAPLPDVHEGLATLMNEPDVRLMGISTARNAMLRPQTPRQARMINPDLSVTYTTSSYTGKIVDLLETAQQVQYAHPDAIVARAFLIDDKPKRVIAGARNVAEDPEQLERMRDFGVTLVAFGPRKVEGADALPEGALDIILMPDWSPASVQNVLSRLRAPVH